MNGHPPGQGPMPPNAVPLLGQRQAQARAAIMQAVQQLSQQIYHQLAASHIGTRDRPVQETDRELLHELARDSQVAAQAYFEGLGIAEFQPKPPPEPAQ